MSSTLEYQHIAFDIDLAAGRRQMLTRLPDGNEHDLPEYQYESMAKLLFKQAGDSNVYDHNNKRARSWSIGPSGRSPMHTVFHYLESVEGGMVKPYGRNMSAEGYIGLYRRVFAQAEPLDQLAKQVDGFETSLCSTLHDAGQVTAPDNQYAAKLFEQHPYTHWLRQSGRLVFKKSPRWYLAQGPDELVLSIRLSQEDAIADLTWLMDVASHGTYFPAFRLRCNADDELSRVLSRAASPGYRTSKRA